VICLSKSPIKSIIGRMPRLVVATVIPFVIASLAIPVVAAMSLPLPLELARYAIATASHDTRPHAVTASDVTNAANTFYINNDGATFAIKSFSLTANLGDLPGYARLIMLTNDLSFRSSCVDLPPIVGGSPSIVTCPAKAITLWQSTPIIMIVSRSAVYSAASKGRAVSGADIVAAAAKDNLRFSAMPTFKPGQGGRVQFAIDVRSSSGISSGFVCVQFPKNAFGIPSIVKC
jgi:hypothetical protein